MSASPLRPTVPHPLPYGFLNGSSLNSILGQNMRLIRVKGGEGDGGGLSRSTCEVVCTRLVPGLTMGVLTLGSSWLSARCAKHSWRKQARLVFPVALVFNGKEELNVQGNGEKERLRSLSL